jgi:hypothetical protein
VSGSRSWLGVFIPNALINGCAAGSSNILSGAVRTARNGNTAPMLIISANDAAIINTSNNPNCPLRLGVTCRQRRNRSVVRDCSPEVELMNGLRRW